MELKSSLKKKKRKEKELRMMAKRWVPNELMDLIVIGQKNLHVYLGISCLFHINWHVTSW